MPAASIVVNIYCRAVSSLTGIDDFNLLLLWFMDGQYSRMCSRSSSLILQQRQVGVSEMWKRCRYTCVAMWPVLALVKNVWICLSRFLYISRSFGFFCMNCKIFPLSEESQFLIHKFIKLEFTEAKALDRDITWQGLGSKNVACFAMVSAFSFPGIPQRLGIHWNVISEYF